MRIGRAKKLFLMILTNVLMISVAWISPASPAQTDKPVASVNGTVLTDRDLGEYMQRIFPAGMFHGTMDPEKMLKYRESAIDLMIEDELLYQEAKAKGLKAKSKELNKAEDEVIKRIGTKERYEAALKQEGMSRDAFRKHLEKKVLIEKILKQEVQEKAEMTDSEIKAYFKENKKAYVRPEARRISHILIKVDPSSTAEEWDERKRKAEEVRQKIADGADFADVAWDYSEDDFRVKGGDLGLMHKGMLDPDLEAKVWSLKVGGLSEVIQTIYGYHIARVEEIKPEEQLTYEQVKGRIKKAYFEKRSKELKEALLAKAREKAKIERYEE